MTALAPRLDEILMERVQNRTNRRVRSLVIEIHGEMVILRGLAPNFHTKQLAQQGVRDLLPDWQVKNSIQVQ